jgi:hypothetical protein
MGYTTKGGREEYRREGDLVDERVQVPQRIDGARQHV